MTRYQELRAKMQAGTATVSEAKEFWFLATAKHEADMRVCLPVFIRMKNK